MSTTFQRPLLEIDGVAVPIEAIWIHHQRYPNPGVHTFRLHLPESLDVEWAKRLGRSIVTVDSADEALSDEGLWWLASLFSAFLTTDDSKGTQYVLNAIGSIAVNEDGSVNVHGICSPFLKRQSEPFW